ncbi:uncharacterized protein Fot_04204 [Forsythia ovata]|uniref:Uncharacterized protein n=1 Tax=Forsythia ovata TaxID=205694 RepID=A0ABD1XCR2_9LAMI
MGSESHLRKAGDCFTLAECYKLAAEAYSKGNFFAECLSACYEGKCFNKGLQYIGYWKHQSSSTDVMMGRFKDLDKIEQSFLESCAKYFHKVTDNVSMMRYVKAFQTMESKRNFLKSLDCLEELFFLEEESANFMEAVEIAELLGDLRRGVARLRKARNFRDATLLILAYMLSFSLWGYGSTGWPLKSFPRKEELKNKAMSFAKEESTGFYKFVCKVFKVLSHEQSNVFELMQCYRASQKHKSLMTEFLSVRKLLDAHFRVHPSKYEWEDELPIDLKKYSEERIFQNQVSARTLFYLWNVFKENILDILESLDCLERQGYSKCKHTVEFCLNYFGIQRLSNNINVTYLLLHPDSEWVENIDERFMRPNRKVVILGTRHFVSAFKNYWHREVLSVGLRVLEALAALYNFSMVNSLSNFCQCTSLTLIFDITKFLIDFNSHDFKNAPTRQLHNFVELSFKYFDIVFPLDSRMSLSENIISLRGTELSRNFLEEVIARNINTENELTYGQIGRAVMIWLGSGRPKSDLYKIIVERFCKNSSWKEFIEILGGITESNSSTSLSSNMIGEHSHQSPLSYSTEALIHRFHKALEDTYNADWRAKDYVSPNCFLYLMERLVFMASNYRCSFFTTKSSFVEYFIYQQSYANQSASLVNDVLPYPRNVFDFVISAVQEFLNNFYATKEWISRSNIDFKYYYPVMVLRLFVILCLLCLNWGIYSNVLFELLGSSQISLHLPREFREALERGRKFDDVNVNTVSEAFKTISDPVVIVNQGENNLDYPCPHAIFLKIGVSPSKKDIMEVLFPRNNETSHAQITSV